MSNSTMINNLFINRYRIARAYNGVQDAQGNAWISIDFSSLEDGSNNNNDKAIQRAQAAGDIESLDISEKGILILVNENNF